MSEILTLKPYTSPFPAAGSAESSLVDELSQRAEANQATLPQLNQEAKTLIQDAQTFAKECAKGSNLGLVITNAFLTVETQSNHKAHEKINQLEALEKKLGTVTNFLSNLESQLANRDTKTISMADHSAAVQEMNTLLGGHKLLEKTSWTRDEAEAIKTALTRHSQIIMQQVHHTSSDVNRAIEEATELLQIVRKCLEMLQQLHQTFTGNQRSR